MTASRGTLTLTPAQAKQAGATLPFHDADATRAGVSACPIVPLTTGAGTTVAVALYTRAWQCGPHRQLMVVAKATFALAAGRATPTDPEPIQVADAHYKGQPLAHVVAPNDVVPYRPLVDVTALGHARSPVAVPRMRVRIAIEQAGGIDKTLEVVGDRDSADDDAASFEAMPLTWAHAYGGFDTPSNPDGKGDDGDDLPNIVDPRTPNIPAGFGPLAGGHYRTTMLTPEQRKALAQPELLLPEDIDWRYFQHAPADQRLTQLAGDACIVLEGFDVRQPRIASRLPALKTTGAIYGIQAATPDAPTAFQLWADSLHIDADRMVATVTWRANIPLRQDIKVSSLLVLAGVACDRPPDIPALRPNVVVESAAAGKDVSTPYVGATAGATLAGGLAGSTLGGGMYRRSSGSTLPFVQVRSGKSPDLMAVAKAAQLEAAKKKAELEAAKKMAAGNKSAAAAKERADTERAALDDLHARRFKREQTELRAGETGHDEKARAEKKAAAAKLADDLYGGFTD
jgi:hypothetical protein